MWITHSYLGTTRGRTKYLLFLLFEDYIDAQRGLPQAVRDELERFARNSKDAAAVVMPFPADAEATRRSILDKPWSDAERAEVRQTPAILMVDRDFDEFDPGAHPWVLWHFDRSDDATYAARVRSFLQKLLEALGNNDDAFALIRDALRNEAVAKASKSFKFEPGAFGVSFDLRTGWDAMKEYLRGRKASGP
jgi:hypothetical protein